MEHTHDTKFDSARKLAKSLVANNVTGLSERDIDAMSPDVLYMWLKECWSLRWYGRTWIDES